MMILLIKKVLKVPFRKTYCQGKLDRSDIEFGWFLGDLTSNKCSDGLTNS